MPFHNFHSGNTPDMSSPQSDSQRILSLYFLRNAHQCRSSFDTSQRRHLIQENASQLLNCDERMPHVHSETLKQKLDTVKRNASIPTPRCQFPAGNCPRPSNETPNAKFSTVVLDEQRSLLPFTADTSPNDPKFEYI